MNMNNSAYGRVMNALVNEGQKLTAKQISARFGVSNPHDVIHRLRTEGGYPIYLNTYTDSSGRKTQKYVMGTPSRKVLAAGYRAMASNG